MILPLVESLWSSLQNEVYFIGGGAAGGLWRHQEYGSYLCRHLVFLEVLEISLKPREIVFFVHYMKNKR